MNAIFDEDFYMTMLRTGDQAGMSIIPAWKAARLMAIIYVWGGGDESITHCRKLMCDVKYIREKYHVEGGDTPDADFVSKLQWEIRRLEEYADEHTDAQGKCPKWAKDFMKDNYGFIVRAS